MLRPYFCDYSDAYIVLKGRTIVTNSPNRRNKKLTLYYIRTILHLDHAYQKSATYFWTMQRS